MREPSGGQIPSEGSGGRRQPTSALRHCGRAAVAYARHEGAGGAAERGGGGEEAEGFLHLSATSATGYKNNAGRLPTRTGRRLQNLGFFDTAVEAAVAYARHMAEKEAEKGAPRAAAPAPAPRTGARARAAPAPAPARAGGGSSALTVVPLVPQSSGAFCGHPRDSSGMAAVRALLERIRLEEYADAFEEAGYDDAVYLRLNAGLRGGGGWV